MADEPQEPQAEQPAGTVQLQFSPVPFTWDVGRATLPNGAQLVTLRIQTPNGIQMFFFEGDPAQRCGEVMMKEGARAAIAIAGPEILSQVIQNGHQRR